MVDEVTETNGPLEVLPGSHTGPIHGLWHNGKFTGAIDEEIAATCVSKAATCTGPAGAVCLMHTRLLHGSRDNRSAFPRTLFISVYSADDAVPLSPNPMPNRYEGLVVRGEQKGRVRSIDYTIDLPELPDTASFSINRQNAKTTQQFCRQYCGKLLRIFCARSDRVQSVPENLIAKITDDINQNLRA